MRHTHTHQLRSQLRKGNVTMERALPIWQQITSAIRTRTWN